MKMRSKRGFTLVELLVVIGIIAVLAGVLMSTFGGANESARAAHCMSNLRNLAVATQNFGMSMGRFPAAGSIEWEVPTRQGSTFSVRYGWMSGSDSSPLGVASGSDSYGGLSSSHIGSIQPVSAYCAEFETLHYSMTNGSIWTYVGKSDSVYRCPSHALVAKKKSLDLRFSYMMNGFFGYTEGKTSWGNYDYSFTSVKNPDRLLLFAEIPFIAQGAESGAAPENRLWGIHESVSFSKDGSDALVDPVVECEFSGGNIKSASETIGFNHKNGKKACAHVAFADGHVAKINAPEDASKAKELTAWLCAGAAFESSGDGYTRVQGSNSYLVD